MNRQNKHKLVEQRDDLNKDSMENKKQKIKI